MSKIIIVPGLNGSGPNHWQSWLESEMPVTQRVHQCDWNTPDVEAWTRKIVQTLEHEDHEDPEQRCILVCHSFGCLAAVKALPFLQKIVGATLLVAPADPAKLGLTRASFQFELPCPVILAASQNDPWMSFETVQKFAHHWRGELIDVGLAGHINVESGFGPWPPVMELIDKLRWQCQLQPYLRTAALASAAGQIVTRSVFP